MVSSVAGVRGTHFDMGRVVERTFAVLSRNFIPFTAIAALLIGLPAFGFEWFRSELAAGRLSPDAGFVIGLPLSVVRMIPAVLLDGALAHATVTALSGNKPALADSLSRALRVLGTLLGIEILAAIAVAVGLLLLLIPGLMLLTIWSVAFPAAVLERTGVFGAFERSAALTRESRWSIFGLIAAYTILAVIIGLIVTAVARAVSGTTGLLGGFVISALVGALLQTIMSLVRSVGIAAIYYELRWAREGIGPQQIAAIFD